MDINFYAIFWPNKLVLFFTKYINPIVHILFEKSINDFPKVKKLLFLEFYAFFAMILQKKEHGQQQIIENMTIFLVQKRKYDYIFLEREKREERTNIEGGDWFRVSLKSPSNPRCTRDVLSNNYNSYEK